MSRQSERLLTVYRDRVDKHIYELLSLKEYAIVSVRKAPVFGGGK